MAKAIQSQTRTEGGPVSDSLFRTKSIDTLTAEGEKAEDLKRTLGPLSLIALGIGAIIGAGLFVRTAAAIAERAGPSVTLAFLLAGVGCLFAGLCYAEFASMIPIAGSAYTYSYTTMGEFAAWTIGWALILEYAMGAATLSIAAGSFRCGCSRNDQCARAGHHLYHDSAAGKRNPGISGREFHHRRSQG